MLAVFSPATRELENLKCQIKHWFIKNCQDKAGAKWYLGKRVAYVYKVKNSKNNTRYRCSWGKVINTHGAAGAVRVSFRRNITPHAQGALVRVMLYPNKTV